MKLTTSDIPQADVIWDVAQVAEAVARGAGTTAEIGAYIGAKVPRQGLYYTQAARIIGLVEQQAEQVSLTAYGRAFVRFRVTQRRSALRRLMFCHEPLRSVIVALQDSNTGLPRIEIARVLQRIAPLAESTALRRSYTVANWLTTLGLAEWRDNRLHYCGPRLPLSSMIDLTPALLGAEASAAT